MANEKLLAVIRDLQRRFSRVDERAIRARLAKRGAKAKLVISKDRVSLRIYKEKNHHLPHFHIEFKKEYSASYAIATGKRLAGVLPAKYEKAMLSWARKNAALLKREWDALSTDAELRVSLKASKSRA